MVVSFFFTGNSGCIEKEHGVVTTVLQDCLEPDSLPLATKRQVESRGSKTGPEATFLFSEEVG